MSSKQKRQLYMNGKPVFFTQVECLPEEQIGYTTWRVYENEMHYAKMCGEKFVGKHAVCFIRWTSGISRETAVKVAGYSLSEAGIIQEG